jgi:hypothetical protein
MRLVLLMVVGGLVTLSGGRAAVSAEGPAERTVAGLDAAVHATWTRLPLREWAARVSTLAGKPVILDRRLDPQRVVTLTARGEPLREVLETVAAAADAAVADLEGSVRIVPKEAGSAAARGDRDRRLRVASLPAAVRADLTARRPWRWPAGARPRDLVAAAASDAGVSVSGIESIPHDHFPAADLPPLPLAERLDLVLAHFDRRVLWEATRGAAAGRIVGIDAEIQPAADGPAPAKPIPVRPPRRTVKVRDEFTLRLEAPLDQALAAICTRLGLTLELDAAALTARGIAPGEIVRAEVEKASRDELLDAVLHPVRLAWSIDGDRLRVFPQPDSASE